MEDVLLDFLVKGQFDSRIALWYSDVEFHRSFSGGFLWKSTVIPHLRMYMMS